MKFTTRQWQNWPRSRFLIENLTITRVNIFPQSGQIPYPVRKMQQKRWSPTEEGKSILWVKRRPHAHFFLLFFAVVPASSLPAFVRQNFRSTFFCVFPFLTLVVTCGKIDLLLEAAFFSVWRRRTKDIWDGECRLSGRVREHMLQKTFIASTWMPMQIRLIPPPLNSGKILETSSWKCLCFRRWKGKGELFQFTVVQKISFCCCFCFLCGPSPFPRPSRLQTQTRLSFGEHFFPALRLYRVFMPPR